MIHQNENHGMISEALEDLAGHKLSFENWTVAEHIKIIDRLLSEETGAFFYQYNDRYRKVSWDKTISRAENLVQNSPARIFNLSVAGSWFSKGVNHSVKSPEFYTHLWNIALRPDSLFCIGMGNDGIEMDSSPVLGRGLRALAAHEKTRNNVIFGTSLMEDAMTLSPFSCVPGKDVALQRRTLSAVGSNVESTLFQQYAHDKDSGFKSGTSMSTPKITAVASVVLSNYPQLDQSQLSSCLLKGATPLIYDALHHTVFELSGYRTHQLITALEESSVGIDISFDQFSTSRAFYKPKSIYIDRDIWHKSQELFAQGRVNISGTLACAEELSR